MKFTRKTFLCTEKQMFMLENLKNEHGAKTYTTIFDMALSALYKKSMIYGRDPFTSEDEKLTKRVEEKVKTKEIAKALKEQPKIDRCINELGGVVVENPDGTKVCNYFTHDVNKSYPQTVLIQQCGEYLVEKVYMPDKETVLSARKDLK